MRELTLGDAEVQDLDESLRRHHDVLGLQVAVDDTDDMRGGQGAGQLDSDVEGRANRHRSPGQVLAECQAVDELHRDEGEVALLTHAVDRDDVWMVESRCRLRLVLEAAPVLRIEGRQRVEHFQGHVASQAKVTGPIDVAHAAGTDERHDLVPGDVTSRQAGDGAREISRRRDERRMPEELIGGAFVTKERAHLPAQLVVPLAGCFEKRLARRGIPLERLDVQAFDSWPAISGVIGHCRSTQEVLPPQNLRGPYARTRSLHSGFELCHRRTHG